LTDSADFVGDFNHGLSSTLLLDADATPHNNHGSDPATHTMALGDSAAIVMDKPRTLTSNMLLADTAHAVLDGYSAHTGREPMNSGGTINIGQPVSVLTSNTASLSNAYLGVIPVAQIGYPIGLALTDATIGKSIVIATEGSVEQADWTIVTGTTTLTVGAWYFLDGPTAGKLTINPITTEGYVAIRVGRAITTTKIDIEISDGVIV
jgi:hypothetical protein